MSDDILRLLCKDEILAMVERMGRDLPNLGYNFLRMYLKWQQIIENPVNSMLVTKLNSDAIWRKVYTKCDGLAENCTIVSISGDRDLIIFIFSYDPDELKECIEHTKLINWSMGPAFTGFAGKHYQNMIDIVRRKGFTLEYDITTNGYYLPRNEAIKYKIDVPDDVRIDSIHEKDYGIINNTWTYRYAESESYLKCLSLLNEDIAVYSKDTNEIKSWCLVDEVYSLAVLHTKQEFTRKGYASMTIKSLARILAEKYEMDTFCFIIDGNTKSERCFTKLGFQKVDTPGQLIWIKLNRAD